MRNELEMKECRWRSDRNAGSRIVGFEEIASTAGIEALSFRDREPQKLAMRTLKSSSTR